MCPFVNSSDPRCSAHLTLREIVTAFAHCAGQYSRCPVYQTLAQTHVGELPAVVPVAAKLRVAS